MKRALGFPALSAGNPRSVLSDVHARFHEALTRAASGPRRHTLTHCHGPGGRSQRLGPSGLSEPPGRTHVVINQRASSGTARRINYLLTSYILQSRKGRVFPWIESVTRTVSALVSAKQARLSWSRLPGLLEDDEPKRSLLHSAQARTVPRA